LIFNSAQKETNMFETTKKLKTTQVPKKKNSILLMMLPYWDPLIPPQGIAGLKNYLQHHGIHAKTVDANTDNKFKQLYEDYFDALRDIVPENRRGNFYNIGHDVLRSHMMAHTNRENADEYNRLVTSILYETFYTPVEPDGLEKLNGVLDRFYIHLDHYVLRLLEEEKPGVLGISVPRDSMGASLYAFKRAKEKYPDLMTVMGGTAFANELAAGSPDLEYFLENTPYIDKIVIGEGYLLLKKIMLGELPPEQRVFTSKDINGISLGFSHLRQPDMSDFNVVQAYPYLAAQGSSSCPYQCSFCNVSKFFGPYKEKNPEQTVTEMLALYKKYGIQLFFMTDSLLNTVATGMSEKFLAQDTALYWDGYLRVEPITCETKNTMLWRRGGFYRARIGVESGSQKVLDLMSKKITIDQTKATISSLAYAGIKTTAYIVIGHPGETEEDFQATLDMVEELQNDIWEVECNPFIFSYTGQSHSNEWEEKRRLLYNEEARKMLLIQSWTLDTHPSRKETYDRVCRFVQHCDNLGIPNPYSIRDIYEADRRWKKLHKNAVPALVELTDFNNYVDECKQVKEISLLRNTIQEDGDFDF
jgi:radical SAM superfamily enzyme YgiQ (UPF0313 family)